MTQVRVLMQCDCGDRSGLGAAPARRSATVEEATEDAYFAIERAAEKYNLHRQTAHGSNRSDIADNDSTT